jgi:hypothetical protein
MPRLTLVSPLIGLSVSLLVAISGAAFAQPARSDPGSGVMLPMGGRAGNPPPAETRSTVAPALPAPEAVQGEKASDYLRTAQGALATGRSREAQEALEMAQTRMLDRSVPMGQTNNPSDNPTVRQITQALQALAGRDRATCMQLIQVAIGSATAQGL